MPNNRCHQCGCFIIGRGRQDGKFCSYQCEEVYQAIKDSEMKAASNG